MTDDLDDLLELARPRSQPHTARLAGDVASQARHLLQQPHPPRRRRLGLVLGIATAGLALTGAGTLAAYQLDVPPFQTLEPGLVRIAPGIPADYTDAGGDPVTCDAFMEFRDVDADEVNQIESYVQDRDWNDLGPAAYRQAEQTTGPGTQPLESRYYDAVADQLRREAGQALPGSVTDQPAEGDKYSGSSISCQPGPR